MKYLLAILLLVLSFSVLKAQELNCTVTVLSPTIQITNKQVFKSMEVSIRDFMNTRRWTGDNFVSNEKIECNIVINITSANGNDYSGTMQIVTSRPAYGTTYNSTNFNFLDKNIAFTYVEFQPMDYQEGVYSTELTALLSYYAYVILGYDYDSYSELGGTTWFQKAFGIVNAAQSSSAVGWNAMEKNESNRYFLINEIMDDRFKSFRRANYIYYRLGLDYMAQDNEKGWAGIMQALELIRDVQKQVLNSNPVKIFFESKSNELIDLFSQAPASMKEKARTLLSDMDIKNSQKYQDKLR